MLVCPSSIDLSSRTLRRLTERLAVRQREIGTRWRRLPAGRQALLALARLRCGGTCARLAAGFGIGIAAVYRYIREAIEVLAARAPTLATAMETARTKAFVILDGTLLPIGRIAADAPCYSGKHKRHGMNVQVLTDPFGRRLWASPALPGATCDLTAARSRGIVDALATAGLKCWAYKAYQGAGRHIRVPFRGRRLKRWKRRHHSGHAKIRCVGEQVLAVLKGWRLLRKLRCSTSRITDIVKAVLVLHHASIRDRKRLSGGVPAARIDAHDLRRRRLRPRGAPGGRERLSAQGRAAGRPHRGGPRRGLGRRAARSFRDAPPHRGLRRAASRTAQGKPALRLKGLMERETEILTLVARGQSNGRSRRRWCWPSRR
ncbi:hypothetical protein GCM10010327_40290 [Streptomyces nitrosporeus]|nr:hypothetical protein GCM10010327_40290 [Streptomyces nitrosporeus]